MEEPFLFTAARPHDELNDEELDLLGDQQNPDGWLYNVTHVVIPLVRGHKDKQLIKLTMCVHPDEWTHSCTCTRGAQMVKEEKDSTWVKRWTANHAIFALTNE